MGNGANRDGLPSELAGCTVVEHVFSTEELAALARADRAALKQHTSRRSCVTKRRVGERQARLDARRLRAKGELVHAYACDRCGGWHVGHDAVVTAGPRHGRTSRGEVRPARRPGGPSASTRASARPPRDGRTRGGAR